MRSTAVLSSELHEIRELTDRYSTACTDSFDPKPSLVFGFGMSAFMLSQQVFEQFIFFGEQRKSIEQSPRIPPCGQMLSA